MGRPSAAARANPRLLDSSRLSSVSMRPGPIPTVANIASNCLSLVAGGFSSIARSMVFQSAIVSVATLQNTQPYFLDKIFNVILPAREINQLSDRLRPRADRTNQ
jgi:hypothetical protein